jgi:low affinity Fe/Cu permease
VGAVAAPFLGREWHAARGLGAQDGAGRPLGLNPWDVAAGIVIVREAGGVVAASTPRGHGGHCHPDSSGNAGWPSLTRTGCCCRGRRGATVAAMTSGRQPRPAGPPVRVPRDHRPLSSRVIDAITGALGHPLAVGAAITVVTLWFVGGFVVGFTNTYQLVVNTGTTIITFVMVFAIQHTTNRETRAINVKLDEVLRRVGGRRELIGAEEESEAELKAQQHRERAAR